MDMNILHAAYVLQKVVVIYSATFLYPYWIAPFLLVLSELNMRRETEIEICECENELLISASVLSIFPRLEVIHRAR